jgi:hypothetical protein
MTLRHFAPAGPENPALLAPLAGVWRKNLLALPVNSALPSQVQKSRLHRITQDYNPQAASSVTI